MIRAYVKRTIPVSVKKYLRKRELLHLGYIARRFLRRIRYGGIAESLRQYIPTYDSQVDFSASEALSTVFKQLGFQFREGHHTVYLYREQDIRRINPTLMKQYPTPFGLKIFKSSEISPDGTPYYTSHKVGPSSSPITMRAVGSIREKMCISNILSLRTVAPRVYDIIKLQSGKVTAFAMVVQHIDGQIVRGAAAIRFFERFKTVLLEEGISILGVVSGRAHKDFTPPDFRNNIVADSTGTYYVDIQNFAILGNEIRRENLAEAICEKTHFGGSRTFRSDRYAYQSVPGLSLTGKRDSLYRIFKIRDFLVKNQLDLRNSAILDVGCNLGILVMYALSQGAHWCVGLDKPEIVEVSRQFLFDQGYSRFDLIGCDLKKPSLPELLPFKKYDLVFYMSIEQHIGFPDWLNELNVRFWLYEGHQHERVEDIITKVKRWSPQIEIVAHQVLQDGDSEPRPMLLARTV